LTSQGNYAILLANFEQGAINTLSVFDPVAPPTTAIGPNLGVTIVTAGDISVVLATAAAYLPGFLDNTIKNPDDLNAARGLLTLSGVACIKEPEG